MAIAPAPSRRGEVKQHRSPAQFRDLAASARVFPEKSRPLTSRAQGMPGARRARSRVRSVESTRVSHHGHTGITRHSPRNGFTAYSALSLVTGLSCHHRLADHPARLDASVGASGPHDFAVRLGAIRQERRRVHRIPPHVRDDRETPLCRGGTENRNNPASTKPSSQISEIQKLNCRHRRGIAANNAFNSKCRRPVVGAISMPM